MSSSWRSRGLASFVASWWRRINACRRNRARAPHHRNRAQTARASAGRPLPPVLPDLRVLRAVPGTRRGRAGTQWIRRGARVPWLERRDPRRRVVVLPGDGAEAGRGQPRGRARGHRRERIAEPGRRQQPADGAGDARRAPAAAGGCTGSPADSHAHQRDHARGDRGGGRSTARPGFSHLQGEGRPGRRIGSRSRAAHPLGGRGAGHAAARRQPGLRHGPGHSICEPPRPGRHRAVGAALRPPTADRGFRFSRSRT